MPNVKLYVDETLLAARREALIAALPPLRQMLCKALKVQPAACQFAILPVIAPVIAMPDMPPVNVEMQVLAHPDRSKAVLTGLASAVQSQIAEVAGARTAVRIAAMVPEAYVVAR